MINVYVDGSFIPTTKEGSYGIVIKNNGNIKTLSGSLGQIRDNNIAEYGAIIKGLEEVKSMGLSHELVKIHTDSQVIFRQLLRLIPPPINTEHSKWWRKAYSIFKSFSKCIIDNISSNTNPAHTPAREALGIKTLAEKSSPTFQ